MRRRSAFKTRELVPLVAIEDRQIRGGEEAGEVDYHDHDVEQERAAADRIRGCPDSSS